MTTTPDSPLGDDEITTEGTDPTGVPAAPGDADGTDADGTDGTDGDSTDSTDGDSTDADGTDGSAL